MADNFYNDTKALQFHLNHPLMKKIVNLKENNFTDKDNFDYAPHDYEDAMDSYHKVMEIVGEICAETLAPNAEAVDAEGPSLVNNEVVYHSGTQENHDKLTKAGLVGMSLPRKYGGLNFPMVPYVMAAEIVSRADSGFSNIWGLQDCAETIHEFASEELKDKYLPMFNKGATAAMDLTEPDAGSDLQAVMLKAHYDEAAKTWKLNGVKRFITNGDADVSLVLARSEEGTTDARGLSLFVYDRRHKAMQIRRIENKLGIKGSPTCELVFKDAPAELVGDTKMGLIKYVMSLMNSARLGVGAQSVGIAEAACREGYKYATERKQFGKEIIQFPAIYEMLRLMRAKTDAARTLLYETSRFVDVYKAYTHIMQERKLEKEERNELKYYQRNADVYTPLLKLMASEFSNEVSYDALQIHGGTGYMKDFPIERMARDARITNIYEGTSQLQVVAAIRGVTNNAFVKKMEEYNAESIEPALEYLRTDLKEMQAMYENAVAKVVNTESDEYLDFHARRLVEMAAYIIMGHLLLQDANKDNEYLTSAKVFIQYGKSKVNGYAARVEESDIKEIGLYQFEAAKEEVME